MAPVVDVGLIGIGSVGRMLLRLLLQKSEIIQATYGLKFRFVLLADSSGIAVDTSGFDLEEILILKSSKSGSKYLKFHPKFRPDIPSVSSGICEISTLKLIFECSPVNLKDGGVGLSASVAAMECGISVVLANKAPIVLALKSLKEIGRKTGAEVKFSATVCGGNSTSIQPLTFFRTSCCEHRPKRSGGH